MKHNKNWLKLPLLNALLLIQGCVNWPHATPPVQAVQILPLPNRTHPRPRACRVTAQTRSIRRRHPPQTRSQGTCAAGSQTAT